MPPPDPADAPSRGLPAPGGLTLDAAADLARTGDLWLFRGRSWADRAIRATTNAAVNHVGMALVLDDLPPLLWHAELGRSLPDAWTGARQRGAQLHVLRDAVDVWRDRYGQQAWLRQLDPPATAAMEDAALRVVARLDGTPFPSTVRLAGRWLRGRAPRRGRHGRGQAGGQAGAPLGSAYCAEVVALAYEAMGLLPAGGRPYWYDPGRFASDDHLLLAPGFRLGGEIPVGR